MNHGPADAVAFARELELEAEGVAEVLLFPPATSLAALRGALAERGLSSRVGLGVQNVHPAERGAYTGEISASLALASGAGFALVGHSERRHLFGETHDDTARKTAAVLAAGMTPILCVGETLGERRAGRLEEVILRQLDHVLTTAGVSDRLLDGSRFYLAYEPVWAIGTGETATPGDASEAHAILRSCLIDRLGSEHGLDVPILYGGSVKPENASELMGAPEVGGVLVGGASLDARSFSAIVQSGS